MFFEGLLLQQIVSHLIKVSNTSCFLAHVGKVEPVTAVTCLIKVLLLFFQILHAFSLLTLSTEYLCLSSSSPLCLHLLSLSPFPPPSLPLSLQRLPAVPPVRAAKIKWCHFSMTL